MQIPTLIAMFAGFVAALDVSLAAQGPEVLLHEVRADAVESWIELHNRSTSPVDLSTWSLHLATRTPGQPQTYWWAFPPGTSIAAGGYLRVFWFRASPPQPGPLDLFTGATPYHFLFGLGGEALDPRRGALALLRSQQSSAMNSPSIIEDWVSWGQGGFPRENLAEQAGRWTTGQFTAAIPAGYSLARHTALVATTTPCAQQWFLDSTPTPLATNTSGGAVQAYGQPCAAVGHHLLGAPELQATSVPVLGNPGFGLRVTNTTGLLGETVLVAFTANAAPHEQRSWLPYLVAGPQCRELIDTGSVVGSAWLRATTWQTDIPMPLLGLSAALAGLELHAQALVFDQWPWTWPPYQGATNALVITVGS